MSWEKPRFYSKPQAGDQLMFGFGKGAGYDREVERNRKKLVGHIIHSNGISLRRNDQLKLRKMQHRKK